MKIIGMFPVMLTAKVTPSFSIIMEKYMNHVTTKAEEEVMECVKSVLGDGQQLRTYTIL